MEGVGGDGTWTAAVEKRRHQVSKYIECFPLSRWIGTLALVLLYALRVYNVGGGFSVIINCALGFYVLDLLRAFLSPRNEPELPTNSSEFKPFIRLLPEFKFWCGITKAFSIAFPTTLFPVFDIPYVRVTMLTYLICFTIMYTAERIAHMILYKYIPFDLGKSKHGVGGGHDTWAAMEQFLHQVSKHALCRRISWIVSLVMCCAALYRWIGTLTIVLLYALRVYYAGEFSVIITCVLGFYLLFLFKAFLSAWNEPSSLLPTTSSSNELKDYELKLWCNITKAFCIAFPTTFLPIDDLPLLRLVLVFCLMLCILEQISSILDKYFLVESKQNATSTRDSSTSVGLGLRGIGEMEENTLDLLV